MQNEAFIVALNVVVVLCCLRVCIAYGRWFWRARLELLKSSLGLLPVSVFWLSAAVGLEGLYYGAARVLAHTTDINLWEQTVPVNAIRLLLITGALVHMLPYWKTLKSSCVACWIGVDASVYILSFIGAAWWLY